MNVHRWRLTSHDPIAPTLAADPRLGQTNSADDQVWELALGEGDKPALALHTRYGGRVGLASLVPMWTLADGSVRYEFQAYTQPPLLTEFAPGYLRAEAELITGLALQTDFFAFDSQSVGARFTLLNSTAQDVSLRFDVVGFAVRDAAPKLKVRALPLNVGGHVLSLGRIAGALPMVLLEGGANDGVSETRVGVSLIIPAGGEAAVRWVHVGLSNIDAGIARAEAHLKTDWDARRERVRALWAAVPHIETGDAALDTTLAFSYHHLLQAFMGGSGSLPFPSFAPVRQPGRGHNPTQTEISYSTTDAYLVALAAATAAPELTQGVIRNMLAGQAEDGWINGEPNTIGQRPPILTMPILARLTWGVFQYTEDADFLRETYPKLRRFFGRWLLPDQDADGDGAPEWEREAQLGTPYLPTFGANVVWGQHADIRTVESPDLVGYLLSEAVSLREMAYFLRDSEGEAEYNAQVERLSAMMETFWREDAGRYAYRDRDTHATGSGSVVLQDAQADDEQFVAADFPEPTRLLITLRGGDTRPSGLRLTIEGVNAKSEAVVEVAEAKQVLWTHARGTYTTQNVFSRLNTVRIEGIGRIYKLDVTTLDTTRLDVTALVPLFAVLLPAERRTALINLFQKHFLRVNGISLVSADDADYDPANERGAGGVWPFYQTIIGEGLVEAGAEAGAFAEAADLILRMLKAQTAILQREHTIYEGLDAERSAGIGEREHVTGVAPLHLLLRVIGVRVISPQKVWAGGPHVWGKAITVRQHGVTITRTEAGTRVEFPSGHVAEVPPGAPITELIDTTPDTSETT